MLKKGRKIKWTFLAQQAFDGIKHALTQTLVQISLDLLKEILVFFTLHLNLPFPEYYSRKTMTTKNILFLFSADC